VNSVAINMGVQVPEKAVTRGKFTAMSVPSEN
jgi:hypothetical protein